MVDLEVLIVLKEWDVITPGKQAFLDYLYQNGRVTCEEKTGCNTFTVLTYETKENLETIKKYFLVDHIYKKRDQLLEKHKGNKLIEESLEIFNMLCNYKQKYPKNNDKIRGLSWDKICEPLDEEDAKNE